VTAGFSVVSWTAGPVNFEQESVGHGLGVTVKFAIVKTRGSGAWKIFHASVCDESRYLEFSTAALTVASSIWGANGPTSSLLNYKCGTAVTSNTAAIAYCFAPVVGYNSFGSYTGNGSSDGVFVYTGMRPRWVLIKRTDTTENWIIHDTARDEYNVTSKELIPNSSGAEGATTPFDILSNGFKMRSSGGGINGSGGTYIYAAFAEAPFKYANAR
jgi:hypothetical protein